MQTRATLALSMHMRYIQIWKILCCPLVLKVIYKVFLFFVFFCLFNSSCCLSPSHPKNFLYKKLTIIHSLLWGMKERASVSECGCICMCRGWKGRGSLPKYNKKNGWAWKAVSNSNCNTLRKKREKGASFEDEATRSSSRASRAVVTLLLAA